MKNIRQISASFEEDWSGIRESNPRLDLGKVAYYHYTNPAWINIYSTQVRRPTSAALIAGADSINRLTVHRLARPGGPAWTSDPGPAQGVERRPRVGPPDPQSTSRTRVDLATG